MAKSFSNKIPSAKGLVKLMETYTLDEIAAMFQTNKTEIKKVIDPYFDKPNFDKPIIKDAETFEGVLVRNTVGAWMESNERKHYLQKILK